MKRLIFTTLLFSSGCATMHLDDDVRFKNAPPVKAVDDRRDTPKKPEESEFLRNLYYLDSLIVRPAEHGMDVKASERAKNVNSVDEVPDSTWFTNRIGVREVTPEEMLHGPGNGEGPDPSGPWTILGTKSGGLSIGFRIQDARGDRYILKFDSKGEADIETGAHIVSHRILWAVGFNVPEDQIVNFTRDRLVVAKDAIEKNNSGIERPLTEARLDELLKTVDQRPDGSYRGLASKFLAGESLGGHPPEGVRDDDPNDVIPHEHRRDIRGRYLMFSWLDHTDIKDDQFVDTWMEDPRDPKKHYVEHYLVDFGKSLGAEGWLQRVESDGYQYASFDFAHFFMGLVSLGAWVRPWETIKDPLIPGVGRFESAHYTPDEWKARYPYMPFTLRDRHDDFWSAKLIMRLSAAHLRAAIDAAKYSDPRAADYIFRTLIERQRRAGRWAFQETNPLDGFVIQDTGSMVSLCFDDLYLKYQLEPPDSRVVTSVYAVNVYGEDGALLESMPASTERCSPKVAPAATAEGYTIFEITTQRGEEDPLPAILVHTARAPNSGMQRIIGIRRL